MGEDEVRIPIFLDVQEDGDVSEYLKKLKGVIDEIKNSSDKASKVSVVDLNKINRAILAIQRYSDSVEKLSQHKDSASVENMEEYSRMINSELETIDRLISEHKVLKRAMSSLKAPKALTDQKTTGWANITTLKELNQYLDALNSKIAEMGSTLQNSETYGNELLDGARDRIQRNIGALNEELGKIAEVSRQLAEAEERASKATKFAAEAKKANAAGEDWATDEVVQKAEADAKAARDYNAQMERSTTETTANIKASIRERMTAIVEEYNAYRTLIAHLKPDGTFDKANLAVGVQQTAEQLEEERRKEQEEIDRILLEEQKKLAGEMKRIAKEEAEANKAAEKSARERAKAEKAAADEIKRAKDAQITSVKQEISAVKQSVAQYYYKLRAVKMLGFVIDNVSATVNRFGKTMLTVSGKALNAYLKLIPGVARLQKALSKTTGTQKKFNRELKSTTKANNGFNLSLKSALMTILKYGLGIRSIYVLVNKLRKAIREGIGQLAQGFDEVNKSMSSIATSLTQMKAAITTIVEPIVHVLAPALEKISALITNISYQVASFIAALSGQSMVFKAVRAQVDYAESLDSTAKNAKKAKQELSGLDKLNVINSDKSDGGEMGFEKVPIDATMAEWAKKFQEFLNRLLKPVKDAWAKMRTFVTAAFKKMLNNILSLGKSVARDFWKVWEEPATQKIFENIFKILGEVFLIIGNIAEGWRKAWDWENAEGLTNGYRILGAIRDIIGIIVQGIADMVHYTVQWSEELSWLPLFTAVADVLTGQIVPAVQKVVDLFVYLYEKVLLEIARYFVEELSPIIVKIFGNLAEAIGNIADNLRKAFEEGDRGEKILAQLEKLVTIIADGILKASEKTAELTANLDFSTFLDSILNFLKAIEPLIQFITDAVTSFWTEVLVPFWTYLIEDGGPKLLDLLGKIFGEYDENTGFGINFEHLTAVMQELLPAFEQFLELGWEVLLTLLQDLGKALDDFINSGTLDTIVSKFSEWVENADPEEIAHKIEFFATALVEIVAAFNLLSKVIVPFVVNFMTVVNVFNNMSQTATIAKMSTDLAKLAGTTTTSTGVLSTLSSVIGSLAVPILIVVGVIAILVGAFGGLDGLLEAIGERIELVKELVSQFAERIGFSETIENLKAAFDNLGGSLEKLRPIFELIFDVLAGIATVIIDVVLGAIDGLILAFTGIIDIVAGVADVIGGLIEIIIGLFTGDYAKADEGLATLITGIGELFLGALEIISGVFNGIAEAIAGFVDIALPGLSESVGQVVEDVKNFFEWLRDVLIGDPIVYDIRDGIIEGFGEWIKDTAENVGGWVKDVVTDFKELASDIGNKVSEMKTNVSNKFSELKSAGSEAMNGLNSGLSSGLSSALSTVSNICSKITDKVRSIFQINSPSKVFEGIGEMLMEGLVEGVDDNSGDVDKSFEDVLASDELLDSFYNNFISRMSELTSTVAIMFDDMALHIEEVMNNINIMSNFDSQFANISRMKVPDIVKGYELPSNAEFKVSTPEFDLSDLPQIIKDAVIEAITSTTDLQSDDETIMINIDGDNIFQVVKNKNNQYKKQHGKSALA